MTERDQSDSPPGKRRNTDRLDQLTGGEPVEVRRGVVMFPAEIWARLQGVARDGGLIVDEASPDEIAYFAFGRLEGLVSRYRQALERIAAAGEECSYGDDGAIIAGIAEEELR